MNQNWENFLTLQYSGLVSDHQDLPFKMPEKNNPCLTAITNLAVLTVTGNDACQFLQGQATCDFQALSETTSCLGAFCTAKGRIITTFIATKSSDTFVLALPADLIATLKKKLSMYVLRSDVKIIDQSDNLCLLGIVNSKPDMHHPKQDSEAFLNTVTIEYPSTLDRFLLIASPEAAMQLWSTYTQDLKYQQSSPKLWVNLDIIDGIPWLCHATSEQFIPQMLNFDQLGGISFNKGCYTGQEVVARTHYLGTAKRQMYRAECQTRDVPQVNSAILIKNADTKKSIGHVLVAQNNAGICQMLVILPTSEIQSENICLDNQDNTKLKVSGLS